MSLGFEKIFSRLLKELIFLQVYVIVHYVLKVWNGIQQVVEELIFLQVDVHDVSKVWYGVQQGVDRVCVLASGYR